MSAIEDTLPCLHLAFYQWCCPRSQALASRCLKARFYHLGLGHRTYGLGLEGLGLGLENCINRFSASPSNLSILIIVIIIII